MKAKRWKQIFLSLVGITLATWGIGLVTAEEKAPYEAEELRLEQGQGEYDLLEGIVYNREKYILNIEGDGGFDITLPGEYEVLYSLTPVAGNAGEDSEEGSKAEEALPEEVLPESGEEEGSKTEGSAPENDPTIQTENDPTILPENDSTI